MAGFKIILESTISHTEKLNFSMINLDSSLLHGLYSGDIVLDNGEKIHVDDMPGHAEDIFWKWYVLLSLNLERLI